ncbi:uncharacterized protein BT62DRAFT_1004130 [Guyanagaster necrorhizus]|uniref:DUF7598 domain-containing protein n=1 Tax=Guyanagaster necrorhizus TaxID=856835 RepID=A0A9P8AUR2_9AGAR|nr:uncharacterized protein BT62DRAFT_1004130 [Guyanagaster necrorhizus MCA 3950]KAG7448326.1 hypothetical protein BT62DRAFT_1004130 [Guyanagaster necrorhizus MCA 3950]
MDRDLRRATTPAADPLSSDFIPLLFHDFGAGTPSLDLHLTVLFYGLNAVRFLSVISLILVFSSTITVMVHNVKAFNTFEANRGSDSELEDCDYIEGSTIPNQAAGVFWAMVSSLLIIFQTIVLLLSEVEWPSVFFERFFPVLGLGFGLGALGIFQCLIGAQILSHHVDDFTLVSAFLLFSIGCLNMLLGLIFRESAKEKRSISAWRSGAKGILPTSRDNHPVFVNASPSFVGNTFAGDEKAQPASAFGSFRSTDKASFGFGRQGEKAAGLRGFILQRPDEALPRYATPSPTPPAPVPVSLSRSPSTRSSTSSFSSPYRPSVATHAMRDSQEVSEPPVFRSSPTAL